MAKKPEKQQTWNDLGGVIRIYGNEVGKGSSKFIKYSTCIAKKLDNGDYKNLYVDVKFGKKAEKPDCTGEVWYDIEEAFITVDYYDDKNGNEVVKPVILVMAGEVI